MAHKLCHAFFSCQIAFYAILSIWKIRKTILCIVSRLRAAFADLRFTLSCIRFTSRPQCMLSIDQWLRTIAPSLGVSVNRLLTYSRFSEVHTPVDFFDCGRLVFNDCHVSAPFFPCRQLFQVPSYML